MCSSDLTAVTAGSTAGLAAIVQYLQANDIGNTGSTILFNGSSSLNNQSFVFSQGSDDGGDNSLDTLIQLTLSSGSAATGLTTAATAGIPTSSTSGAVFIT